MKNLALCLAIVSATLGTSLTSAAQGLPSDQSTLTLEDVLKLAKDRNGTVKAAMYDYAGARSSVAQSLAAFFPTITPVFQYNSDRSSFLSPGNTTLFQQTEGASTFINSSWRVLDTGQRQLKLLSSRRSAAASKENALQTLRSTLYAVYSQYIESLRAQQLLKVNQAQVQRATAILDQTKAQVRVGEVAAKEILQAQADALNAQVDYLTAKNRSSNAVAGLRSIIGWDSSAPLPTLVEVPEPATPSLPTLADLLKEGVSQRADLVAARRSLEALHFNRQLADRNAGPTASLDASFDQTLTPHSLESRALTFTVSAPLFDGGLSREQARQAKYQYLAAEANYVQQERQARADIEAAYATTVQDAERITAAKSAREAAQENFKAASESQKAGASNLIDVLTAQVSLVTAESNYIQALYDFILSDANLKLVTGMAMPGEGSVAP